MLTCRELGTAEVEQLVRTGRRVSAEVRYFENPRMVKSTLKQYMWECPSKYTFLPQRVADIPSLPFEVAIVFSKHDIHQNTNNSSFVYCVSFKATRENCPELKEQRSVVVRSDDANFVALTLTRKSDKKVPEQSRWEIGCAFFDKRTWAYLKANGGGKKVAMYIK
eukprot:PhM_4_TR14246/c1_g4_i6/m.63041